MKKTWIIGVVALGFIAGTTSIFAKEELLMCTMQYDPVCGVDGKTYENTCTAGKTEIAHQGECIAQNTYTSKKDFIKAEGMTCDTASDGVNTFWGENFSLSTRIGYPENFIAEWKCININIKNPLICTTQYIPVCGVDGKTYGNRCGAGNMKIDYEGECIKENGLVESLDNELKNLEKTLGEKAQKINKNIEKYKKALQTFSEQKRILLNGKVIQKLQSMEDKLFERQPLGTPLPKEITNTFNLYRYLELKLQIVQNSFGVKNSENVQSCDDVDDTTTQCKK